MKTPELNKVYTTEETLKAFTEVFTARRGFFCKFYLPTETVVKEPSLQMPDVARCFSTEWFDTSKGVVTYEVLSKEPGFCGTCGEKRLYCMEIWADYGDDGHVGFERQGYAFFSTADIADLEPKKLFEKMLKISNDDYDRKADEQRARDLRRFPPEDDTSKV